MLRCSSTRTAYAAPVRSFTATRKTRYQHDDDEVRFILDGEGIFDIRTRDERWMRVVVERGDLIVVPKDRHHRFMLTNTKSIKAVRLFKDESGWVPHHRDRS